MHTTVDEHAAHIENLVRPAWEVRFERMPLLDALGRVSASSILSPVDLPLFRNSQMDGFAVRAADVVTTPIELPVAGTIAAASGTPPALRPGTAVRIMTGAPVPDGADAIVPVEDTIVSGETVTIGRSRTAGEYIRERGSDLRAGAELVPAASVLASRQLAAIAAGGITEVEVRKRARIAVITTGAELVSPGAVPEPGQVFDSNSVALVAAVRECGGEVALAKQVPDDPVALRAVLSEAARRSDLIITSGGISKGDFEVVREVLEPLGARISHVAMQPGGPQATAVFDGVPVVCFPGNPVSTQVSFEVFLAPLLRSVAGLPAPVRGLRTLAAPLESIVGKRQFLRGRLLEDGTADVHGGAGSHLVAGLAAADALIVVPEQSSRLAAGDLVEVWQL